MRYLLLQRPDQQLFLQQERVVLIALVIEEPKRTSLSYSFLVGYGFNREGSDALLPT